MINNHTISAGKNLISSIDLKSYLSQLFLSKVHMIVLPESNVNTEIIGGLNNVSFTAETSIGYAHTSAIFDNQP